TLQSLDSWDFATTIVYPGHLRRISVESATVSHESSGVFDMDGDSTRSECPSYPPSDDLLRGNQAIDLVVRDRMVSETSDNLSTSSDSPSDSESISVSSSSTSVSQHFSSAAIDIPSGLTGGSVVADDATRNSLALSPGISSSAGSQPSTSSSLSTSAGKGLWHKLKNNVRKTTLKSTIADESTTAEKKTHVKKKTSRWR
ncbi:hypothetical protein H0H93_016156, partial [Arthromyces matolae]